MISDLIPQPRRTPEELLEHLDEVLRRAEAGLLPPVSTSAPKPRRTFLQAFASNEQWCRVIDARTEFDAAIQGDDQGAMDETRAALDAALVRWSALTGRSVAELQHEEHLRVLRDNNLPIAAAEAAYYSREMQVTEARENYRTALLAQAEAIQRAPRVPREVRDRVRQSRDELMRLTGLGKDAVLRLALPGLDEILREREERFRAEDLGDEDSSLIEGYHPGEEGPTPPRRSE